MLNSSLITYNNPKSPISEAYRVLRTNIQYSSIDNPLKVIVVTSSGPGEGKSTTVINTAITFAQAGSKVLVIDGDLRKPKIHKLMGLENKNGLTNILASKGDFKESIKQVGIDGIEIITCGAIPPNPSELLSSKQMKMLIQQLREEYDLIMIDAPPVGNVTDAAILSTICDGTILVTASGQVDVASVKRAKELLQKVNANIVGVVLNKLDKNSKGNYYYYYYYYYGEQENSDSKKSRKRKPTKNFTIDE